MLSEVKRTDLFSEYYANSELEISMFQNEKEGGQILITPSGDIKEYTVSCSDLKSAEGASISKEYIKFYNENYDIFQNGKYYRLSDPKTDDYAVFEYVYENRVVVGAMRLKTHAINLQTTLKLKGLEEDRVYTDNKSGEKYYGAQLMQYGIPIESCRETNDYSVYMWHFKG